MRLGLDCLVMITSLHSPVRLFGLNGNVNRWTYFAWGFGLAILKYVIEAAVISSLTGQFYSPLDYLTPLLSNRARFTEGAPSWLGMTLVLWTLPFVWIAVAMSLRRCRDAGLSPWFGMVMLIPILNYIGMFVLSLLPTDEPETDESLEQQRQITELWKPLDVESAPIQNPADAGANSGVVPAIVGRLHL